MHQIADLIRALPGHDVVVGYRVNRQDNAIRIANAHAWNWLIRNLFAVPVRDVDCAFKLFDRRVLQGPTIEAGGAMFSSSCWRASRRAARASSKCPSGTCRARRAARRAATRR